MEDNRIFDASKFLEDFKELQKRNPLSEDNGNEFLEKEMFNVKKCIDKTFAKSLDFIKTKIFIENYTNHTFCNLIVQDNLYSGTTFIIGSCYINNENFSDIYPQLGIKIKKLEAFEVLTISFLLRINISIPLLDYIEGFSTVFFEDGKSINSNITKINLIQTENNKADRVTMQKVCKNLCCYEINKGGGERKMIVERPKVEINLVIENLFNENGNILCKIQIKNSSKLDVFEIKVIDDLEKEEGFLVIPNKIKLNGRRTKYNSLEDINIDKLKVNETYCIEFKVIPYKNIACKNIELYCCFKYYDNNNLKKGYSNCCNTELLIERNSFKDCVFNFTYNIPSLLDDVSQIDDINIECFIENSYPIKTYRGTGYNENLTGDAIKVLGEFLFIIEYTSIYGTIHSIDFKKKFSSIVIITEEVFKKDILQVNFLIIDSIVDIVKLKTINVAVNILFFLGD